MWTEEKLNEMLTTPSAKLIEDVKKIDFEGAYYRRDIGARALAAMEE